MVDVLWDQALQWSLLCCLGVGSLSQSWSAMDCPESWLFSLCLDALAVRGTYPLLTHFWAQTTKYLFQVHENIPSD